MSGGGIVIRKCETSQEFHACVALQREVWEEDPLEIEPPTMFVVAANTGGQVLGAFDGPKLVAYILAVAGLHGVTPYIHSHHAAVHAGYRDRGIGRALKLFQREEALSRGIRLIEWTFDPLELRNAHFNLNRLGAIARQYRQNLYGVTSSPLHRGIPTDRLVAEWWLDSRHVLAAARGEIVGPANEVSSVEVPLPLGRDQELTAELATTTQVALRQGFTKWFERGYAAVSVRSTDESAYILVPWNDEQNSTQINFRRNP
jgi:predicted GNAT superfamily acetyltransferase